MKTENGNNGEAGIINGSNNGTTIINNTSILSPPKKRQGGDPLKSRSLSEIYIICLLIDFWVKNFGRFISLICYIILASSRKRRKGNGSGSSNQEQPKNAVAILNELKKNLVYQLENQEGPYHAPVFTMSVMVKIFLCCCIFPCLYCVSLRWMVKNTLAKENRRS